MAYEQLPSCERVLGSSREETMGDESPLLRENEGNHPLTSYVAGPQRASEAVSVTVKGNLDYSKSGTTRAR